MSDYSKKFVAIDLETTHLDMKEGKVMEVGAVEVELYSGDKGNRVEVKFGKTFSSLVNPEIEPSETALVITGIKKETLKDAPLWNKIKPELEKFVGESAILGHNIGFDLGYLGNQGLKFKNETLDTLELSRTLLPLETSHSLESLAASFAVLKDAPHRALVDCQNTARVAAEILNKFLVYPKKLQEEVKEILGKSNVNFIHMVEDLPEMDYPQSVIRTPHPSPLPHGERGQKCDIEFVDKTVYCYPLSFNGMQNVLENLANRREQAVIGLSHAVFLADLAGQTLTNPSLALCEQRFSALLEEETLSPEMAKILAKITILHTMRQSLDLSELKWAPEEMQFLHYLTVNPRLCPKHVCRYVAMLAKKTPKPVFADLGTVFELARDWSLPLTPPEYGHTLSRKGRGVQGSIALMLFDLAAIEDQFTDSCARVWNLKKLRNLFAPLYGVDKGQPSFIKAMPAEVEKILNELDLFFGILHLVYLKREGEFAENLVIDETERNQERFAKLFHPAKKLQSKLHEFAKLLEQEKKLAEQEFRFEIEALAHSLGGVENFLQDFFLEPTETNIAWLKFNSSWVDLNLQPTNLNEKWKNFTANFSAVTIVDTILPQVSRAYFQKRLGISDYDFQKCLDGGEVKEIPVKIFSKHLTTAEQIKFFAALSGRTLLLLPNESKLTEFYQALRAEKLEETEVLAYKFSGNVGALKKKLKDFRGEKLFLLLTMHALSKHWRVLPALENLIIFKLPFEARGSKVSLLGLPDTGAFIETILPRAISILHRTVTTFLASTGEGKRIFILDPRILTDYDQSFMKYFEEFPDFAISTD